MLAAILSLILKIYNRGTIKSIQTGSFTATPGLVASGGGQSSTGVVAITSVNPLKACVIFNGITTGVSGAGIFYYAAGSAYLTSATTVACSVSTAGYVQDSVTVFFTVVEYN